ncbi:hypothetical protein NDU88_004505 [Pleurodeles waltl]|uniref:Uncharacterized protein n=1 Tax=Pleurodeles waltl TaxID=8319 RepID=A0AAV7SJ20_PLEWA|nr:hypothetical protein NDU88_004505 [Pleurodeles waltl]
MILHKIVTPEFSIVSGLYEEGFVRSPPAATSRLLLHPFCSYRCRYSPEGEFAPHFDGSSAAPARPGATRQPPLSSRLPRVSLIVANIRVLAAAARSPLGHRDLPRPQEPEQEAP